VSAKRRERGRERADGCGGADVEEKARKKKKRDRDGSVNERAELKPGEGDLPTYLMIKTEIKREREREKGEVRDGQAIANGFVLMSGTNETNNQKRE
jgi:hypothetical protein